MDADANAGRTHLLDELVASVSAAVPVDGNRIQMIGVAGVILGFGRRANRERRKRSLILRPDLTATPPRPLDPRQLMAAVIENLDRHFFAASRDSAKQMYKALEEGKIAKFMHVGLEDDSELFCHLALDTTEHVGKLNFGRFRKGLAMMMLGAKNALRKMKT